ncbi:MAG: hypothetical protein ABMA64_11525 [Myxococcota bacterium]
MLTRWCRSSDSVLRAWFVAALAAGCGDSESEFVVSYVDTLCQQYVACVDPALQVFDGLEGTEACEAEYGDPVAERAAACKLERSAASECLAGMSGMGCPAEGEPFDAQLPPACASVWKKCEEGSDAG